MRMEPTPYPARPTERATKVTSEPERWNCLVIAGIP
jgi:hypothetical protein